MGEQILLISFSQTSYSEQPLFGDSAFWLIGRVGCQSLQLPLSLVCALQCTWRSAGLFLKQWMLGLWCMKRNPAHYGSQYQIPFSSLLFHHSDKWREYVSREDFSSEAAGDGEPGSCKTISGASKTEKRGQKVVSIDSGVEYKQETRTSRSDLYLMC